MRLRDFAVPGGFRREFVGRSGVPSAGGEPIRADLEIRRVDKGCRVDTAIFTCVRALKGCPAPPETPETPPKPPRPQNRHFLIFYGGFRPREVSRWIRTAFFIQIHTFGPQNLNSGPQIIQILSKIGSSRPSLAKNTGFS